MDLNNEMFLAIGYRCIGIMLGFFIIRMGNSHFKKRNLTSGGELSAELEGKKISLKDAPIGTFFIVLGTIVMLFSIWKGVETTAKRVSKSNPQNNDLIVLSTDTTILKNTQEVINIDSLMNLAKVKIETKKYLDALNYLYFIKGVLNCSKDSPSLKKEVEYNINLVRSFLLQTEKNKNNKNSDYTEETRSSKINNEEYLDTTK